MTDNYETKKVLISEILIDDDFNCRGKIIPLQVLDLVESIKEQGLLQPVLIARYDHPTYKYKLIAGFRRTFAHKVLKMTEILATIREPISDVEALSLNLTENLHRENLNIAQEARAIHKLFQQGLTEQQISFKTKTSRGWVQTRGQLLDLEIEVQEMAEAGLINTMQIKELHKIKDRNEQLEAAKSIKLAREKGEKSPKVKQKVKDLQAKRERKKAEMMSIMDFIFDSKCGASIATRVLSWCAGEINTEELLNELRDFYAKEGKLLNPAMYSPVAE